MRKYIDMSHPTLFTIQLEHLFVNIINNILCFVRFYTKNTPAGEQVSYRCFRYATVNLFDLTLVCSVILLPNDDIFGCQFADMRRSPYVPCFIWYDLFGAISLFGVSFPDHPVNVNPDIVGSGNVNVGVSILYWYVSGTAT